MDTIHIIRIPARRMVTGARDGLSAACSSAPDRGTTFIIAILAIGPTPVVAGATGLTVMAITLTLMDMVATAVATTVVRTPTEE